MESRGTSDANAAKLLEPGDMFGDYTVEKLLGAGGMGAVYLVRAPGGERYAVKVMFPEMVKKGSDYRKRFAREAEFAMQIRHKNLISVYDVGEDPETGLCYIIMDYVPGGSVADRLERGGPLPMAEAVSIAAQVALALEVAHRHGVIHRDIKPENIMFDADGTPKLADLGVAKFTDGAHKTTVTTTGMIIGTPAYMAPEQMMDSHHVDARADIYALGVVLYEMLTGKRPNEGSTAVELLAKAIKGEPLPDVRTMRPEISAAVAHVLSLMCAPKPEGRPATALEAAQLLQKAATGRLVLPKKPPRAADAAARKKKRGMPWALLAVCAVVCALGAAVVANLLSKQAPPSLRQSVVMTNVIERTSVVTNVVQRSGVVTNVVEQVVVLTNVIDHAAMIDHAAAGRSSESAGSKWRPGPTPEWFVEWDKALAESRRTGKAMFLLSMGSDWCHWCVKLTDEVLNTPEFAQFAAQNLVLVYLDNPRRNPLCKEQKGHNRLIVKTLPFGGGVPFALIANANGEKLGDIRGGGLALNAYLERLRGICSAKGEPIPGGDAQALFADGYAKLADTIAARRAALPPVSTNDFKAILTGIAVVDRSKVHASKDGVRFLPPETDLEVPYGKSVLFRVEYDFPEGYSARVWTRDDWPAADRRNSYYFGSNPSGLYSGKGTAYGFLSLLDRGEECTLKSLSIKTKSDPELDKYPQGWTIGTTAVNLNFKAKDASSVVPHASKTRLHALYRSKDKKRAFVEIPFCDGGVMGFENPPGTLARLDEAIAAGVDIMWLHVRSREDGVLAAVGKNGDALEALLKRGKGKALFKMYAGKSEIDLLKRLNAWESVIFEVRDLDKSRVLLDDEVLGKIRSGELQIMIHPDALGKWSDVTQEFSVWSRSADLKRIGLFGIPQHVESYFGWDPGEAGRTDDEAGWDKALSDGITIFRTKRPRELLAYLKRRTGSGDGAVSGDDGKRTPSAMKTLLIFPSADPKDMKWKARPPWRYVTKYPAPSGGSKWTEPAFRDSGWKRSNKPLGAGKGKEIMRIADRWSSSSLYLRRHFAWKGGKVARVEFTLYHACNVKIYLNGDLVLEKEDRNDWWEKMEIPAEAFAAALRDGDNVLAVEAQDNFGTRYFDCGLTVEAEESK